MIKKILDEIANESGTNKKIEILESYKSNELLKKVLYMSRSKRIKFYLKQIPSYVPLDSSTIRIENMVKGLV